MSELSEPRTITLRRVVVTGLGFVSSIGQSPDEVAQSLRETRNGIGLHPNLANQKVPAKLAGIIKGYDFPDPGYQSWIFPEHVSISRPTLRSMGPNGVYGYVAMKQAVDDSGLPEDEVSNPRTGLMTGSIGSVWLIGHQINQMLREGYARPGPMEVVNSIAGSLGINLATAFKIHGSGFASISACSSSAHAIGTSIDEIRLGRQDVMFAVGAEESSFAAMAPFTGMRALTNSTDPDAAPCAFDAKRDGFAPSGGGVCMVLEELEHAKARGAKIYCEAAGYGQTLDGYNVMAPEPTGSGLARAIQLALQDCRAEPADVDYINAHATATEAGDKAELAALKKVFGAEGRGPLISSTKSITGHGLCLAGVLEAAICCLSIKHGITPVSAKITELDPAANGHNIVTQPVDAAPAFVLSNSSAFGGSNVVLAFKKFLGEAVQQ